MEEIEHHGQNQNWFKRFFAGKPSGVVDDNELLAQKMLRELGVYLVFLMIISFIAFGSTSAYSYHYTKVMQDLFLNGKGKGGIGFDEINSVESFWEYLQGPFQDSLYWDYWYNNKTLGRIQGYIYHENKLLGRPRLQQVRVKQGSCSVATEFASFIDNCYGPYNYENEDKDPFGKGTRFSRNGAWSYRESEEINGFWHWGEVASYNGGGYVQDLSLTHERARVAIRDLHDNLWVRRGTRAVFITFTVYNANINLFCVIVLTVEFPHTGGAFPSSSFTPFKLIHYDNNNINFDRLLFFCEILFCFFNCYYMSQEAIEIFLDGPWYFKDVWNIMDLLLVVFSTICIGCQLYREFFVVTYLPVLLTDFKKYLDFTSLAFWESRSSNMVAITLFVAWAKVFKYLSFNKTMTQLATTLSRCAKDLIGFFIMFIIVFLSYTQLGFLLFGSQLEDFSTFINAFFTLFRIILGDFDFYQLERANPVLGPIFFMLFVFFVFFVLINMFLAIVNDTYSEVRTDSTKETNMCIMSDYLRESYRRFIGKIWQGREIRMQSLAEEYATKYKVTVAEWQQMLIEQGFEAEFVEAVIQKFGLEHSHILVSKEQKKVLSEIRKMKKIVIPDEEDEEDIDELKATNQIKIEKYLIVLKRVKRMETVLYRLMGNVDAILLNFSTNRKKKT